MDLLWKKTRTDVDYILQTINNAVLLIMTGNSIFHEFDSGTFVVVNAANGEKDYQRTVKVLIANGI